MKKMFELVYLYCLLEGSFCLSISTIKIHLPSLMVIILIEQEW